jgi:HicA toxin of bacterial toxin-antitoxin,
VKIISGKRMCRVLEQRGWTLARINGSHHIYRHAVALFGGIWLRVDALAENQNLNSD